MTYEPTTRTHSARKRFKRRTNFPRLRRNPLVSSRRNPFTQDGAYVAEQCDSSPSRVQSHQASNGGSRSSAVERTVHIGDVAGSIPAATTTYRRCACVDTCLRPKGRDAYCPPLRHKAIERPARKSRAREIPPMTRDEQLRLWGYVDMRGDEECWPWTGGAGASGHGRFLLQGVLYSPHRLICHLHVGSLNGGEGYHGKVAMHTCDNPRCCNPKHLRVGTQKENAKDMADKGRGSPVIKKRVA